GSALDFHASAGEQQTSNLRLAARGSPRARESTHAATLLNPTCIGSVLGSRRVRVLLGRSSAGDGGLYSLINCHSLWRNAICLLRGREALQSRSGFPLPTKDA